MRSSVPGLTVMIVATLWAARPAVADAGEASSAEIRSLVTQLGDRSFARRSAAQRRLCELGPVALDALHAAATGSRPEVAIRAREIIKTLWQLLFSGVKVTLEGPDKPVAWNDAVRVVVVMENTGTYPAHLPVFPESLDPARAAPAALEAARLVDFADFLSVTDPRGRHVDLHVDNIGDLEPLEAAIHKRLASEAVVTLAAGRTRRVVFEAFNRGWARYRLLQKGTYRVQLDYTPAWDDDDLRRRHVRRVQSNAIRIDVKQPAPPLVRRDGRPVVAELTQRNGKLVAELRCTSDVPIHINTALGARLGTDARLIWVVRAEARSITLSRVGRRDPNPVADAPAGARFHRLTPGDRFVIATLQIPDLFADRTLDALKPGASVMVQARYVNLLSRSFLCGGSESGRKELLPPGMTVDQYVATLPARIYTGEATTNLTELTKPR